MKELDEFNTLFCEVMFESGSVKQVAEELGITQRACRALAFKHREQLLAMTTTELAIMSARAVRTLDNALYEDGSVPKGDVRLKAAESILDRVGASKRQIVENEITTNSPIIFLPAKDPVTRPLIVVSQNDYDES